MEGTIGSLADVFPGAWWVWDLLQKAHQHLEGKNIKVAVMWKNKCLQMNFNAVLFISRFNMKLATHLGILFYEVPRKSSPEANGPELIILSTYIKIKPK